MAQDVRLFISSDGGGDWDGPIMIDDGRTYALKTSPRLLLRGNGRVVACWNHDRDGVWAAASIDDGRSWGRNVRAAALTHIGVSPLAITTGPGDGDFCIFASLLREGAGDGVFLIKGQVA